MIFNLFSKHTLCIVQFIENHTRHKHIQLIINIKTLLFFALGAGGRGFESRYPDKTKKNTFISDFQLITFFNVQL